MRNLVAFYATKEQAKIVKDELADAGFHRNDVKIFEPGPGAEGGGLWERIKEAFGFADEQDRQLYAEASRRGAWAVGISFDNDADEPSSQRAVQIMQKHNPLDLDTQAARWRQEGWTGYQQTQQRTQTNTAAAAAAG